MVVAVLLKGLDGLVLGDGVEEALVQRLALEEALLVGEEDVLVVVVDDC